jgi:hypothetical protein
MRDIETIDASSSDCSGEVLSRTILLDADETHLLPPLD